jgi:hypothetical protein
MREADMGRWVRKVPGFRSGQSWKQFLAVFGYGLLVSVSCGLVVLMAPAVLLPADRRGRSVAADAAPAIATPLTVDSQRRADPPATTDPAGPNPSSESPRTDPGAAAGEVADPAIAARPQLSPAAQAYFATMQPKFALIAQDLGRLGEQHIKARNNPNLLRDAQWKAQTFTVIDSLSTTARELQTYRPVPIEVETLNALMVEIGKDLEYVADEYTAGIQSLDQARIANATRRVTGLPPKAQQAMAELQRLAGG